MAALADRRNPIASARSCRSSRSSDAPGTASARASGRRPGPPARRREPLRRQGRGIVRPAHAARPPEGNGGGERRPARFPHPYATIGRHDPINAKAAAAAAVRSNAKAAKVAKTGSNAKAAKAAKQRWLGFQTLFALLLRLSNASAV